MLSRSAKTSIIAELRKAKQAAGETLMNTNGEAQSSIVAKLQELRALETEEALYAQTNATGAAQGQVSAAQGQIRAANAVDPVETAAAGTVTARGATPPALPSFREEHEHAAAEAAAAALLAEQQDESPSGMSASSSMFARQGLECYTEAIANKAADGVRIAVREAAKEAANDTARRMGAEVERLQERLEDAELELERVRAEATANFIEQTAGLRAEFEAEKLLLAETAEVRPVHRFMPICCAVFCLASDILINGHR